MRGGRLSFARRLRFAYRSQGSFEDVPEHIHPTAYRFLLISLALIRCRYELADVYLIRGLVQPNARKAQAE